MKNKGTFAREEETMIPGLLLMAVAVLTLGMAYVFFYDDIYQRNYMVNRRRLIRLIGEGGVKLLASKSVLKQIREYEVEIEGVYYRIWIWKDGRVTLATQGYSDYIGLFLGSWPARRLNARLKDAVSSLSDGTEFDVEEEGDEWD